MQLEQGHTELSRDTNEIRQVQSMDGIHNYVAGERGCSKIVAFDEHGQGDWVPWVAIYAGERVWIRMPAANLKVFYL